MVRASLKMFESFVDCAIRDRMVSLRTMLSVTLTYY